MSGTDKAKVTGRRSFLIGSGAAVALAGWAPPLRGEEPEALTPAFNPEKNLILAPRDAAQWPEFRRQLAAWRDETRKRLNYDGSLYGKPEFSWSTRNYSCCFAMMWDETFYDWRDGRYNVDAFLDHGTKEFGGYDSIVLWHAYPRIGVDDRNQFDFYRDMPGGLEGVRKVVDRCHARGVKVYIEYNPWDTGTRRENQSDVDALVEMVRALDVDGLFLDTMSKGATEFRVKLDAARPGVILEGEAAVPLDRIADHHASWAQEQKDSFADGEAPGVLRHKWLERRHMQHQISRWRYDHTAELQTAWMNGSGMMVWENVFGSWVPWSERDRSILRAVLPIQRRYADLLSGERWTPLVPSECAGVYASLWEGDGLRLWTLVNRTDEPVNGPLLKIAADASQQVYDLVAGKAADTRPAAGQLLVQGTIPPHGIGCLVAGAEDKLGKEFAGFLQAQSRIAARANYDAATPRRPTKLTPAPRTQPADRVPEGMVEIPAARLDLEIEMRARECGFYESMPPRGSNLKADYVWQPGKFRRRVDLARFAIDATPVTNAQFAQFLKAAKYEPKCRENFLKHWNDGKPPAGKEDHPVVYVDLGDARAYAQWVGKRLPTEEEWQYAAQGSSGLTYPWGREMAADRCNDGSQGGTTAVKAFPMGHSPLGCYDMCGNVWHWTESERSDGRTRFCIIRGGCWLETKGSKWYVEGGPRPANWATKFLLLWPGLDRCATIGFRCVKELTVS